MCLATTFTWCKGSARKDGSGISSSNVSFGWIQSFTSETFWWMLEDSSYCAVIVADDDINGKKQLYNASSTIFRIAEASILFKLPKNSLGTHVFLILPLSFMQHHTSVRPWNRDHYHDLLASPTNYEGMPAKGVTYPTRWSILPYHFICNCRLNFVVIFSLIW